MVCIYMSVAPLLNVILQTKILGYNEIFCHAQHDTDFMNLFYASHPAPTKQRIVSIHTQKAGVFCVDLLVFHINRADVSVNVWD